ncbi:hypothetical protein WJX74_006421 [Apatococcus lobatus]|uniref:Cleavage and polyadenylation specificity factor subunit 2 n=1 Tax=Apatococcus lobatus TaxID=904363 RepID=A0AAW1QKZ5_9CHLO
MEPSAKFTPLYGAKSTQFFLAGLLQVEGVGILLDCGWDIKFDVQDIQPLAACLSQVDVVLISHLDVSHLGALPWLVGKQSLEAPIFGTLPIQRMGRLAMTDHLQACQAVSDFQAFSSSDVAAAFERMTIMHFQERVSLTGKARGFEVMPFAAGHLVGGCVWQITTPSGEVIVYAPDFNNRSEHHLNPSLLMHHFTRPALVIAGAPSRPRLGEQQEANLLRSIVDTLRGHRSDSQGAAGNVLLPIDSSGRVLELLLLLEKAWSGELADPRPRGKKEPRGNVKYETAKFGEGLAIYPLAFLSYVAQSTLEFARSQLEFMNDSVARQFERQQTNPFMCRHVRTCHTRHDVGMLNKDRGGGPKVVLATLASLEAGLARQLFIEWARDPKNLIVFPLQAQEGSVAAQVQAHEQEGSGKLILRMSTGRWVPLEGAELEAHLQAQKSPRDVTHSAAHEQTDEASHTAPDDQANLELPASAEPMDAEVVAAHESLHQHRNAAATIDGFQVPEGAAGPMFDGDDANSDVWDQFGYAVPEDFFQTSDAGVMQVADGSASMMEQDEVEPAAPEVPRKLVQSLHNVQVNAKVASYHYDGLADSRSLLITLTTIAPRQLIVIHGTAEASNTLRAQCIKEMPALTKVHAPASGETIDLSLAVSAHQLQLSARLLQSVTLHSLPDQKPADAKHRKFKVAWMDGTVIQRHGQAQNMEVVPAEQGGLACHSSGGVFLGSFRLSGIKQALEQLDIRADFAGPCLVCPGPVTISIEDEELTFAGPLSSMFFQIRDIVYQQHLLC